MEYRSEIVRMLDAEYFTHEGLSCSSMKLFDRSPAHMLQGIEPTKAMDFGSMVHLYLLQPEEFAGQVAIEPENPNRRSKEYQEWKASVEGKIIASAEDIEAIGLIADRVRAMLDGIGYGYLMDKSQKDVAIFWEQAGVQAKGKADMLYDLGYAYLIADIKTCQDASGWYWDALKYQYHRQAAWYQAGVEAVTGKRAFTLFVCVEKTAPYGVIVWQMDENLVIEGKEKNLVTVESYKAWVEAGKPAVCYAPEVQTVYGKKVNSGEI